MAKVYTQADIDRDALQLKGRWLELKLRLTDWLAETIETMPIGEDYRGVKSILDSISQLEKLIGNTGNETMIESDLDQTKERTQSIIERLKS